MLSLLKKLSRYSSNKIIFEVIYFFFDPWKLNSKPEIYRYKYINNFLLLKNNNHKYKHILEVGCGEGHHTKYLTEISENLTSIDISSRAISKCKKKNFKNVNFLCSILEKIDKKIDFDLILVSEVVYYIRELDLFFENLNSFKTKYLITSYFDEYPLLEKRFESNIFEKQDIIYDNKLSWKIIYKK